MKNKILIVGSGVAGIFTATKLIKDGYPGNLITIIDKGENPYTRPRNELMHGFAGAGLMSDGKWSYLHNTIGGHLVKYVGEEKADQLLEEAWSYIKEFHPHPEKISFSNPIEEPDFIKPNFNLRLAPTYHIGTDYLIPLGRKWYDWLVGKEVNFFWNTQVTDIDFTNQIVQVCPISITGMLLDEKYFNFDKLIFAVGKSGMNFANELIRKHQLKTEPKSVQIGVRFEAPQHHFQKLIDISYDFKLHRKYEDEGVSIRTFCVNNISAYVAVEETYGDISYNGHAKKDPKYTNNMTNFGIILEIKNIEDPFHWSREIIKKCQNKVWISKTKNEFIQTGLYYSPNGIRKPSKDSEGNQIKVYDSYGDIMEIFIKSYGKYSKYILDFIEDLKKTFPTLKDDWGIYIPEVKYVNNEVLVNYEDLSLVDYPNIHFVGDVLSARGISVSSAHGVYVAESILRGKK